MWKGLGTGEDNAVCFCCLYFTSRHLQSLVPDASCTQLSQSLPSHRRAVAGSQIIYLSCSFPLRCPYTLKTLLRLHKYVWNLLIVFAPMWKKALYTLSLTSYCYAFSAKLGRGGETLRTTLHGCLQGHSAKDVVRPWCIVCQENLSGRKERWSVGAWKMGCSPQPLSQMQIKTYAVFTLSRGLCKERRRNLSKTSS